MFPELARFTDVTLLLLRVVVGVVFITSGWKHVSNPAERSKDIEMSKGFTVFLGAVETRRYGVGIRRVVFGILTGLKCKSGASNCALVQKLAQW
jgi:putative oxidoreductase